MGRKPEYTRPSPVKTIVVIGERTIDSTLTHSQVAYWRQRWDRNTPALIRNTPAPHRGETKERLLDLTSLRRGEIQVVNLLPPDRSDSWEEDFAELCAMRLLTWMRTPDCQWERIILLGKRVSQTLIDRTDVEFGTVYDLVGTPALCYPHPSGRSHYLNENCYRERARNWAHNFLRSPK